MSDYLFIIFGLALLLAVGAGVLIVFLKPKKVGVSDADFKKMWQRVTDLVNSGDDHKVTQAIVEADKLMDLVLKKKVSGDDMGGRLRNAKGLFTADGYNRVWEAHKLRNRLVHEVGVEVPLERARAAVSGFAKGFRDLGYK